jgi:hypothetical protein
LHKSKPVIGSRQTAAARKLVRHAQSFTVELFFFFVFVIFPT